jgi:DNA-binding transcriptional LysR family regulator
MQDLNDMLYFAEVAEAGGFSAAARRLGIPKTKLSRRVAELESRLGVRLLHRTTRRLSLTAVGEVYLRHCVSMREAAQAAAQAVEQVHTEPRGTVRVACPVTLAQATVGPIMAKFLARYPQVKVDMRVSNRAVDLVEEGFDVALRVRATTEDSGSLVVKLLGPSGAYLVASAAQLDRQGHPKTPHDLASIDSVAMSSIDGKTTVALQGPGGVTFTLVHTPRYVVDDLLTLKFAVVQGAGMGLLPDYMCHSELADGRLVMVLPGWAPKPGVFHAVYPTRRGMVPAVRRFLDFLGEYASSEGNPLAANATSST